MAEPFRYEAERAAWIRARQSWWPSRPAAARRAEQLARTARQLDRSSAGVDESALHEGQTKGVVYRWTRHEDATTSALGLVAFCIVYGVIIPVYFGVAWIIGTVSYRAWETAADRSRPRVWPYLAAAVGAGSLAVIGRPLGWDLWLIHSLAGLIETATGGLIAPEALSRWYAAGWVSWIEIQVVLGCLYGGWLAYAWGWEAPAVRRGYKTNGGTDGTSVTSPDKTMQIISARAGAQAEEH